MSYGRPPPSMPDRLSPFGELNVNDPDNVQGSDTDRIGESAAIPNGPSNTDASIQPIRINDSNTPTDLRTIKRAVLGILLFVVLGICSVAQELIIPLTLALLLSLLLSPAVTLLERVRLPRALSSILVVIGVIATVAGGVTLLSQPAGDWVAKAPATIQSMQQRFRVLREPFRRAEATTKQLENLTQSTEKSTVVSTPMNLLSRVAAGTPRVLSAVVAVLLLVYFFLSSGNGFLRRMVEVVPSMTEKRIVVSIARDLQAEMSRYLVMISIINLGVGAATAATMVLLGVPDPLLWGAFAGILNFAPYVGPTLAAIGLALVGFTTFNTLGHALAVPGAFLAIAFVEGQLITPTIIGRRLALDPTAVFVWLLVWGWLWGIPGVLLAGPMIACFRIVCEHVDALKSIGVLIGDGSSSDTAIRK
jgi:predicted PurR-regulated permease PerM